MLIGYISYIQGVLYVKRLSGTNRIILVFIILSSIAWSLYQVGMPFADIAVKGATTTTALENELFEWSNAKKFNYNARYEMAIEVADFNTIVEDIRFIGDYAEEYRGSIISQYEYVVRVPIEKSKEFKTRVKSLGNTIKFSSDFSTSLGGATLEAYNDTLLALSTKRTALEKLRRDNPVIKGYTKDIQDVDLKVNEINNLKNALQNRAYDLYLLAFSERFSAGINTIDYTRNLFKNFAISLAVLLLGVPIIFLSVKLLAKLFALMGLAGIGNYNNYYSKGYKSANYGYNYGRKRKVKRVYKDKENSKESKDK